MYCTCKVEPGLPTDTDSDDAAAHNDLSMHVEPGAPMETKPIVVRNLPTLSNEFRCINCGADVSQRRRHSLNLVEVQSLIAQWIAPQTVGDATLICHSCWTVALHKSTVGESQTESITSSGHHRHVCVNCGLSLLRRRFHMLGTNTERETHIRNTIVEWIRPRQLKGSDKICHPCWQRSDRAAARPSAPQQTSRSGQPTINLPHLTRAPDSQGHCFFPECGSTERLTVPKWLRVKLFTDFKFYVPGLCRICSFHLDNDNWVQLGTIQQPIHSFTAKHIEDFATFVN